MEWKGRVAKLIKLLLGFIPDLSIAGPHSQLRCCVVTPACLRVCSALITGLCVG